MVNQVNPPPHAQIPAEFKKSPAVLAWANQIMRILFQLWTVRNTTEEIIITSEATVNTNTLAQFIDLQQRLGSGDELTIDTTGFTIDTTNQFTDQAEA